MPKQQQLLLRSKTRHNHNPSPRSLQLIQTCTNNTRVSTCWETCFYIFLYFRTYLSTSLRKTTWSQLLILRLSSSLMKLANSLQLPTAPGHPRPYTFPPSVLSPHPHLTHNNRPNISCRHNIWRYFRQGHSQSGPRSSSQNACVWTPAELVFTRWRHGADL